MSSLATYGDKISSICYINDGFWNMFIKSFGVIFFAELADNTFILLLFFSLQVSKFKLFLTASAALVGINVVSVLIGHSIPLIVYSYSAYINLIAMLTLFAGGIVCLDKANKCTKNTFQDNYTDFVLTQSKDDPLVKELQNGENKLLLGMFISLVLGEIGDRSTITAIAISTINDLPGTLLGSSIAHLVCVILAIYTGQSISKYLSEKQMLYIGAIVFFLFAVDMCLSILGINFYRFQ